MNLAPLFKEGTLVGSISNMALPKISRIHTKYAFI